VGRERAEGQTVGVFGAKAQFGFECGQIDQPLGYLDSSPKLHHHVGAAGNEPGIGVRRAELGEGIG